MNPKLCLAACLLCVAIAQSIDARGCDDTITIGHISEDDKNYVDCDDDPGNPICEGSDDSYIEIKAEKEPVFQWCKNTDDDDSEDCLIKVVLTF